MQEITIGALRPMRRFADILRLFLLVGGAVMFKKATSQRSGLW